MSLYVYKMNGGRRPTRGKGRNLTNFVHFIFISGMPKKHPQRHSSEAARQQLQKKLQQRQQQKQAQDAIENLRRAVDEIGPDLKGETEVMARLDDPDVCVRVEAIQQLGKLEPVALAPYAYALVAKFEDSEAEVRGHALEAMAMLETHTDINS